jgi:hypothetical protein
MFGAKPVIVIAVCSVREAFTHGGEKFGLKGLLRATIIEIRMGMIAL